MKKFYAILCIAIASLTQLQAQAPQGFNYQATVRNSSGDLIINTNVYFKFNVIQGSQTAVPIFTETHYVPTDDLGQVNLVIGQGTANTGVFSELDWSLGSYYLGIELDTGSGYVAMGTTQLLSVPYALYAENSGNATSTTPNLQSVLAENNSAGQQQIKNLLDPTEAQDAVTKNYTYSKAEIEAIILETFNNLQSQIDNLGSGGGNGGSDIGDSGEITDIDGNSYNFISYGNQKWTVQNANMVTYSDGTPIPEVEDADDWSVLTTGAWCSAPGNGRFYNWYAVAGIHDNDPNTPNKKLAPEGWHVPSDSEWTTFENYLITNAYNYDGTTTGNKIAKSMASSSGWMEWSSSPGAVGYNQGSNNSSDFNAFAAGDRIAMGTTTNEGYFAFFWSSSMFNSYNGIARYIEYMSSQLNNGYGQLTMGLSVRFVKD